MFFVCSFFVFVKILMIKVLCESLQDHLQTGGFTRRTHNFQKCYTHSYSLLQEKDRLKSAKERHLG